MSMESVHPILANALNSLQQGNTDEAEKGFAEAAAACLQEFGEVNIVTARTLAHLARVRASRDKVDLAVDTYEKILRIHKALPEPCSSDHVIALLELAELQARRGVHAAATDLRNKADCIMVELQARMKAAEERKEASSSCTDSSSDEESDSSSGGISDDEKSDGNDELGHDVSDT